MDPTTRAAPVRIALENPDGLLRPGMSAQARVLGAAPAGETMVTVPRGAVQSIDGQPYVFVELSPGRFEVRPVERGAEVDGEVEIAHGLHDGEPVATDGTFVLKSEVLREQMGSND
jgi:cobalt-zinc-cadmium efflux system membrane fusion protein